MSLLTPRHPTPMDPPRSALLSPALLPSYSLLTLPGAVLADRTLLPPAAPARPTAAMAGVLVPASVPNWIDDRVFCNGLEPAAASVLSGLTEPWEDDDEP